MHPTVIFTYSSEPQRFISIVHLESLLRRQLSTPVKVWNGKFVFALKNYRAVYDTITCKHVRIERNETSNHFNLNVNMVIELQSGNIASCQGNKLNIYDKHTFKKIQTRDFPADISCLCQFRDGRIAFSGTGSWLCLYDLVSDSFIFEIEMNIRLMMGIVQLYDGSLAVGGLGDNLFVVSLNGTVLKEINCGDVCAVREIRPGILLVACGESQVAKILDVRTGSVLHTLEHPEFVKTCIVLRGGLLATTTMDTISQRGVIHIYTEQGKLIKVIQMIDEVESITSNLVEISKGKLLCACTEGAVIVDIETSTVTKVVSKYGLNSVVLLHF
jgi:WD40 repeat protein